MDEQLTQPRRASSWLHRDGPWLIALLVVVAALRFWLIVNTEVTARDSIGFIRYSLLFDRMSWSEAVNSQHQHPGYPAVIWVVSQPVRAVFGVTPESMRLVAQSISLVASLLLAVMMFHLGKLLWDRFIGFFAALTFQFLPISGHHLSDGISDGLFLLLVVSALFTLIRARDTGSKWRYALGGAFVGVAYLTRPEGLLVLPAAWLFLVGLQFARNSRKTWTEVALSLLLVTGGCVVAGSPYYAATGKLTIKVSARQILEEAAAGPTENGGWPLFASLFAANFTPAPNFQMQLQRTLRALLLELCQALNYVGAGFVVWAAIFCRKTLLRHPGFALLAIYFSIHALILVKLGLTVSYVSDRHVMALVALASYPCVIGMMHLCTPWARFGRTTDADFVHPPIVRMVATACLVVTIGICASKSLTRLHGNRIGNHEAGLFLAAKAKTGDLIDDDHNWSNYYAGNVLLEGREPILPASATPTLFVVMTRSKDAEVRERRELKETSLKQGGAKLVYQWPINIESEKARIVVYAMPRRFETHPWKKDEASSVFQPVGLQK